ncbi:hypothetical protein [Brevundimonas sp. Root1279]|uniref:hypothetical protein n=1 Tax=Brevundimonas sp. Root1279 TaxID=1736443 RepID=UPI0007023A0E|nr:hypothetical protein [Brevundimonas sp. Root1279]KQW81904.1 hypothetical protein ASC65_11500 [Brevundimonas sp. Root1279]
MFRIAAAAAALVLCASGAAQAQTASPLVNHFVRMCGAANGDATKALAEADRAEWIAIPASAFADTEMPFTNLNVRMGSADDSLIMLMVGDLEEVVDGMTMHMKACGVVAVPVEDGVDLSRGVQSELQSWLGMKPHPMVRRDDMIGYAFTLDENGSRRSLEGRSEAAMTQAAMTGRLNMIMVGVEEGSTLLFYAVPSL